MLNHYCDYLEQLQRLEKQWLVDLDNATVLTTNSSFSAAVAVTEANTSFSTMEPNEDYEAWWEWRDDHEEMMTIFPTTGPPETIWTEIIDQGAFETFRKFVEWKLTPCTASVGILFNCLLVLLLRRHRQMPSLIKNWFTATLIWANIYLASVVVTAELHRRQVELNLDDKTYLALTTCCAQFFETWCLVILLAVVQRNTKRAEQFRSASLSDSVSMSSSFVRIPTLVIIAIGLGYFFPSLPPVRVALHRLYPDMFKPCFVPLIHVMEISEYRTSIDDTFFIFYHFFIYILLIYVMPILILCWYMKDLSDTVAEIVRKTKITVTSLDRMDAVDIALVVLLSCSVFACVVVLKLALLLFVLCNHGVQFLYGAEVFFQSVSIAINYSLLIKSMSYLIVALLLSIRIRWLVRRGLIFLPRKCLLANR